MKDKRESIDVPGYNPDERVAFPPKGEEDYMEQFDRSVPPVKAASYTETYAPEAPAPDPSQTQPGQPNIRDINTPTPEGQQLRGLSPDVDLKE